MKKLLPVIAVLICAFTLKAQSVVVVADESKLYDSPNVKSYATTNTEGANVLLSPGMVFASSTCPTAGWTKVEYTPGLFAYMLSSQLAKPSALGAPKPGTYKVTNDTGASVEITLSDNKWSCSNGETVFPGEESNNAVVFKDKFSNPTYSLVVYSGKTYVYSYDNKLTKFF